MVPMTDLSCSWSREASSASAAPPSQRIDQRFAAGVFSLTAQYLHLMRRFGELAGDLVIVLDHPFGLGADGPDDRFKLLLVERGVQRLCCAAQSADRSAFRGGRLQPDGAISPSHATIRRACRRSRH